MGKEQAVYGQPRSVPRAAGSTRTCRAQGENENKREDMNARVVVLLPTL